MVNGYNSWLDDNMSATSRGLTLEEHTAQARMSGETRAAAEAVGQARGVSAKTAQEHRREEVRRVREMARERAEKQGTSVEPAVLALPLAALQTKIVGPGRTDPRAAQPPHSASVGRRLVTRPRR
jgi:hypothetical protein